MPLDTVRWNWSHVPLWLQGVGVLALLCSLAGIFLSIRENQYLSPTVRLQRDRGHSLVDTGIYRSVRHPLYGSASLFYLAVPVLLGSELGFVVAPTFIGMLMLRTVLEERMLCRGLAGYSAYLERVKYRFMPHIW